MKGIYKLYLDDTIVYIGKSLSNVKGRIDNHLLYKDFDRAEAYEITNEADIAILEMYLIAKHKPVFNMDTMTVDIPTITVDDHKLLNNPVIYSKSYINERKKKFFHKTKDFEIMKDVINSLTEDGYSMEDITIMIEEIA